MSRFKLRDRVYDVSGITELSILDAIQFDSEASRRDWPFRWADVLAMGRSAAKVGSVDPGAQWVLLGSAVWAARRAAGENVGFAEAIDFPLTEIEFLPEPEEAGPTPRRARPASGRASGSGRKRTR